MPKKNVFISHIHEDDHGLGKIKDLLSSKGVQLSDQSISSENPNKAESHNYIKYEILAPRIRECSVLMVYITPDTKNSTWVDWEIQYAQKQGIRIVGVWAHGENECDLPQGLKDYANAIVGWHGNSIIDAINGEDNWKNPNGAPCTPFPFQHYTCG